jgi:ABC-type branched-subunit amino acid transport system permease subunit
MAASCRAASGAEALAAYPLTGPSNYLLGFLLILFMYAALASAWNILGGYAGYLSFWHAAFFGLGAYTTAVLLFYLGWSPFLTAPLAGHDLTPFEPLQSGGYQARCRRCHKTVWTNDKGLLYS